MCAGATGATLVQEQEFVSNTPTALSQLYACESAHQHCRWIHLLWLSPHPVRSIRFGCLDRLEDGSVSSGEVVYLGSRGLELHCCLVLFPCCLQVESGIRQTGWSLRCIRFNVIFVTQYKGLLRQFLVTYGNDRMHLSSTIALCPPLIQQFSCMYSCMCFVSFRCQCPTTFWLLSYLLF